MRAVIVPKLKNDSLAGQLLSLYESLKGSSPNEELNFDLSQLDWASPLLVLPICAYINTTKSKFNIDDASKIKSYLETVNFPDGIDSVSEFQQQIQRSKNYIPISVLQRETRAARERLEGLFSEMVYKTIDVKETEGVKSAIYYPIGELVNNIFEHSKQDQGFVFGQFYPKKDYLDICIVDRGRGLATAYKEERNLNLSDDNAIAEVMRGHSTKPDKERGYGVWTSKRVVCEGLGGEFIMVSGSAALVSAQKKEKLVSLPNFYWQGVIVAYRIPKPRKPIAISGYLE